MKVVELVRRAVMPRPAPAPVPLEAPDELMVFGADWCGDCRRAKRYLDATGVRYAWVDLLVDTATKQRLAAAGSFGRRRPYASTVLRSSSQAQASMSGGS